MGETLKITRGSTYTNTLRWGIEPIIYRPIQNIFKEAPARIQVDTTDLPPGWPIAVTAVLGMTQINAKNDPPEPDDDPFKSDYKPATIVGPDMLTLNHVNAARFSAYTEGGYIQFYTPVDLYNCTARMAIRTKYGDAGVEVLRLTSAPGGGITFDNVNKRVDIRIEASATEDLAIKRGVYDLEIIGADGTTVTAVISGNVVVGNEATVG